MSWSKGILTLISTYYKPGGKNVKKRNQFYRRSCLSILASVCYSGTWSIDSAGSIRRGRPSDRWQIWKCFQYFRSRYRKFFYADGYLYHYKPCNGIYRNNRSSYRRTETERSRKCSRNNYHTFPDHRSCDDICTGIRCRWNCTSVADTCRVL